MTTLKSFRARRASTTLLALLLAFSAAAQARADLIISEFLAENNQGLEDEDGDSSDWIEIHNPTDAAIDLNGWYLSDDPVAPTLWTFPDVSIGAGDYMIVFASGKDRRTVTAPYLHTNFSLNKDGEYLALRKPDATVASGFIPSFSVQDEDISYGFESDLQTEAYFMNPSPGGANGNGQPGLPPSKPTFSRDGGVFTDDFFLTLTTDEPGATIRYTTNGGIPSLFQGQVYTDPIRISSTTTVRAVVETPDRGNSSVRGQSYIEVDNALANFSSNLPIVIVDSFGRNVDTESNPGQIYPYRDAYWVIIDTDPSTGRAQVSDAPHYADRIGMKVRGQTSAGFPKKQYSIETWNEEDEDKKVELLGFPVESDWILHAPYSDKTLMRNALVYTWARSIHNWAPRMKFVEVFYNRDGGSVRRSSDYRGVYLFMEKIKRDPNRVDIAELSPDMTTEPEITGGYIFKKDKQPQHDVTFNTSREGHTLAFVEPDAPNAAQQAYLRDYVNDFEQALHGQDFADPEEGYRKYIDTQSFIKNHIMVELAKNIDGFRLSTYWTKDRNSKMGMEPVWDYNLSLGNANYLTGQYPTGWYNEQISTQQYPYFDRLFQDPEFELEYWDTYYRLRRNELSDERLFGDIDDFEQQLSEAQARNFQVWNNLLGRFTWPNADGYQSRTTHAAEVDWMRDWLRNRMAWYDEQFLAPPAYSKQGGLVESGFSLSMSSPAVNLFNPQTKIFYTTDGSDPRSTEDGGEVIVAAGAQSEILVPTEQNGGDSIALDDWLSLTGPSDTSAWISGPLPVGFDLGSQYQELIAAGTDLFDEMYNKRAGVYVRTTFNVSDLSTIENAPTLVLNMQYDDGFVAYLNGTQIASANAPASPAWDSIATSSNPDDFAEEGEKFNITARKDLFVEGENILAIHGMNSKIASDPDLLFGFEIKTSVQLENDLSPAAKVYTSAIQLDESATVSARVLDGDEWGALNSAEFIVGGVPASADNLVVSKMLYEPPAPTEDERLLGYDNSADFEYLELMNIGNEKIDLSDVLIVDGIEFDFANASTRELAPGDRLLLVENIDAFTVRHGGSMPVAGQYSGKLNNAGETVMIQDRDGNVIKSFSYASVAPWPTSPDEWRKALVLLSPMTNPDHNDPANWAPSLEPGGNPGGPDELDSGSPVDAWLAEHFSEEQMEDPAVSGLDADPDGDSTVNLIEFAFGGDPLSNDPGILPTPTIVFVPGGGSGGETEHFGVKFTRPVNHGPLTYQVEVSTDLGSWVNGETEVVQVGDPQDNGDGTETVTFRDVSPATAENHRFMRIVVEQP